MDAQPRICPFCGGTFSRKRYRICLNDWNGAHFEQARLLMSELGYGTSNKESPATLEHLRRLLRTLRATNVLRPSQWLELERQHPEAVF
jgi:hypothetical protein